MSVPISPDGETWYECSEDQFQDLLANEYFDCWVDMSGSEGVEHVRLSAIRKMLADGANPNMLYGLPIVYEKGTA